ncbi:MAG: peptidoglycan DD-metalloendopeptidase family protein [Bacteroidetes bacterium]|nr:peptidoglycan DD-metalloendopeptidase family protein [Bacteroidota bacterium]
MNKQLKNIYFSSAKLLIIGTIIVCFSSQFSYAQTDKNKLQENKKKIEQEIQFTNNLLNETKKNKQTSLNQLVILKNQIGKREELITNINDEINVIVGEISTTEKSVDQLNQELASLKAEYTKMIIAANRNRSSYSVLMFIFASEDFNQAYQRLKYYQQYSVYRKKQIKLIQQTQDKLTHKKQELEVQKLTQKQLLSSNESEKKKLTKEQEIKNLAVQNLQKTEKALLKTLRKKEAEAKKLQKDIEHIIAEEVRKAREAAILRAEAAKRKSAKTDVKEEVKVKEIAKTKVVEEKFKKSADIMSATPEELELSTSFTNNKGRLPWPSEKGIISSTFGPHSHPELPGIVINNDGIDITTNRGANARAVFNGEVAAVISGPNGKQVVIIRHGNYLTVYSNLETVFVKRGEKVSTKQRIGSVYTDNEDNKTILQFQIWKGNAKMNPSEWIAR